MQLETLSEVGVMEVVEPWSASVDAPNTNCLFDNDQYRSTIL
jgi:hypothetical protein